MSKKGAKKKRKAGHNSKTNKNEKKGVKRKIRSELVTRGGCGGEKTPASSSEKRSGLPTGSLDVGRSGTSVWGEGKSHG